MANDMRAQRFLPTIALATAGSVWGTGFLLGKIALSEMPVADMVLFRFVVGCAVLVPCVFFFRSRFDRAEWGWVLGAAALGVPIQYLVQFEGLALTSVSHASLMVASLPMLLAVAAAIFSGERLRTRGWFALVASSVGAALIAFSSTTRSGATQASALGDMLVVASMVAAIGWILISKRLMRHHAAVMVTVVVYWIGTAMLAVAVVAIHGIPPVHYSRRAWLAVLAQGLLVTAATTLLWNWGLKRVPASRAGIFVNLEPLVGAILGVIVLHDALGSLAIAGGVLILGGAVYFSVA